MCSKTTNVVVGIQRSLLLVLIMTNQSKFITKRHENVYLGLSMLGCGLSLVEAGEATVVPVNKGR